MNDAGGLVFTIVLCVFAAITGWLVFLTFRIMVLTVRRAAMASAAPSPGTTAAVPEPRTPTVWRAVCNPAGDTAVAHACQNNV